MDNKKLTIVILAAGMGSRYGGLKQVDTFSLEGDTIIDFSLYDAIQAGFSKVVFVIRANLQAEFNALFENKLRGKIKVEYVYQELENIPAMYRDSKREKPWGTGHALLLLKDIVKENFAVINADDFYSRQAFDTIASQLRITDEESYDFSMVAYSLKNTVSENGYVSRGECTVDRSNLLVDIIERTRIERINGDLKSQEKSGEMTAISEDTTVSMNFWGFTPKCFEFVDELFLHFLEENKGNLKIEFYLPFIVSKMIQSNKVSVKVLESNSKWFGVTYSKDRKEVENEINTLKENSIYPMNLWSQQ
jgi:dTDP-glucose pyrophosphorylase